MRLRGEVGSENLFRKIAIFTTATGAVVGGLVDRSIKEKTIMFRSPSRHAVLVGISPLLALGWDPDVVDATLVGQHACQPIHNSRGISRRDIGETQ